MYNISTRTKVLSVVMPCYNESSTIEQIIDKVLQQKNVGELIIVNDGSTDNSKELIKSFKNKKITLINKEKNQGKGAAISSGLKIAKFPFVVIQDADLEYDPKEYPKLLKPLIEEGNADVVFGSRFLSDGERRTLYYWHRLGNKFLTTVSNMFTNLDLTDMETCYKIMRIEVARKLEIKEKRFGVEPEFTARIAKMNLRIYEIPISYYGRTYEEGKKITWKDGFSALRCILKYNLIAKNHD